MNRRTLIGSIEELSLSLAMTSAAIAIFDSGQGLGIAGKFADVPCSRMDLPGQHGSPWSGA
jgi:hypothetical protein